MIALILALMAGLVFSFFALQNTQLVNLQFQNYMVEGIPLYIVAVSSMLIGVVISFAISLASSLSSQMTIFSKNQKIKATENSLSQLEDKIAKMEEENEKLRSQGETKPIIHQSPFARPNLFQRLRHRLYF